jgi:hypothetical protein
MAPGPEPEEPEPEQEDYAEAQQEEEKPWVPRCLLIRRVKGQVDQHIETATLREAAALAEINLKKASADEWLENPHGIEVYIADIRN